MVNFCIGAAKGFYKQGAGFWGLSLTFSAWALMRGGGAIVMQPEGEQEDFSASASKSEGKKSPIVGYKDPFRSKLAVLHPTYPHDECFLGKLCYKI